MLFQRPNNELDQAVELKELGLQPAATAPRDVSEPPAQMTPEIEQHEAQANQQETVRRVRRGGPAADLASTAVARLDPEAAPVLPTGLARSAVQLDLELPWFGGQVMAWDYTPWAAASS